MQNKKINKFLKVKKDPFDKNGYNLWIEVGCQSFAIYMGPIKRTEKDAKWFKKSLNSALNNIFEKIVTNTKQKKHVE